VTATPKLQNKHGHEQGFVFVDLIYCPVSLIWHISSGAILALLALHLLNAVLQSLHAH
jgi:hypothetical protein